MELMLKLLKMYLDDEENYNTCYLQLYTDGSGYVKDIDGNAFLSFDTIESFADKVLEDVVERIIDREF